MKLAIIGSRNYIAMDKIRDYVYALPLATVIISGGARGVDKAGVTYARQRGMKTVEYLPDWKAEPKRAGFIRNDLIVSGCDCVVAFWDGRSTGTLDTIKKAVKAGKVVKIYPDKVSE